jgi:hypothetical protein
VLRICPLYFFFLFCFVAAARLDDALGTAGEQADLLVRVQPWYWTYTVNVPVARDGWAAPREPRAGTSSAAAVLQSVTAPLASSEPGI